MGKEVAKEIKQKNIEIISQNYLKIYLLFLYGTIIGVLFDIFFYNKTLGISYPIFITIILGILAAAFWKQYNQLNNLAWILVIPIMLLSLTFFIFTNQVLKILNYLIVPLLIVMLSSLVSKVNKADWSDIRFIGDIAKRIFVPFRFIHRPFLALYETTDIKFSNSTNSVDKNDKNSNKISRNTNTDTNTNINAKTNKDININNNIKNDININININTNTHNITSNKIIPKVIAGVLISIPILAIVLWLLTSADIVFKNFFINIPITKIFKHFLIIISVSIYTICFIWSLLKAFAEKKEADKDKNTDEIKDKNNSQYKETNKETPANKKQKKSFLDPIVLITILTLTNIVYTIFSFIQFKYLFGGNSYILPSNFTYAEYARRGFIELVIVTIINFAILIFSLNYVKKENKKFFIVIKSFLTLLVAFTFVLLASAFYRLVLYEQAFGFTYLRVFVQTFMIMLFCLFILNIVYIWYSKIKIVKFYFIISLSIYIMMNFANVDAIIAKNNIRRYFETGNIDLAYLKGLSYDAIPEIKDFYLIIKDSIYNNEKKLAKQLLEDFKEKDTKLKNIKSWQSFNISRYKAEINIERTK